MCAALHISSPLHGQLQIRAWVLTTKQLWKQKLGTTALNRTGFGFATPATRPLSPLD